MPINRWGQTVRRGDRIRVYRAIGSFEAYYVRFVRASETDDPESHRNFVRAYGAQCYVADTPESARERTVQEDWFEVGFGDVALVK